ncbi:MAG: Flp family type IVb pilin [Gemmatimonadaceae bacterium]|nr:Flp family type IVb pilin [Gemmatimonadaceae bacterium]
MLSFTHAVRRFVRDEDGASLAEYALLLGVITVALIAVIQGFRNSISNIFQRTTNTLNSAS